MKMVDKECTCVFHQIQLFNKHTKILIKHELQDQHIVLCHQYKGIKSVWEVDNHYVLIYYWGFHQRLLLRHVSMSSEIGLVFSIYVSNNGFMVHVSIFFFKKFMIYLSCLQSKHEFHLLSNSICTFSLTSLCHFKFCSNFLSFNLQKFNDEEWANMPM